MNIAIHARELEYERFDGTRNYISALLKKFADLRSPDDLITLYHAHDFNSSFCVPEQLAQFAQVVPHRPMWTQTQFARALWRDKPDVLWMPFHNLPLIRRPSLRTVVTIHDLAFKYFPETFLPADVRMLNLCTDYAVKASDTIIAVSESTKKDIIDVYGSRYGDKIKVVYHGFDQSQWYRRQDGHALSVVRARYKVRAPYIMYMGAIQPRKNLESLIEAFEILRVHEPQLQLVLAGGDAWHSEQIHQRAEVSSCAEDIIFTGRIETADAALLMEGASVFVYPSLYEGFGIPILEAFAMGVPVVTMRNSSLPEVAGEAAYYVEGMGATVLAEGVLRVLSDDVLSANLVKKGCVQVDQFSWNQSAAATYDILTSDA